MGNNVNAKGEVVQKYVTLILYLYEDLPGEITFKIGILKAMDENGSRFAKKEVIEQNIKIELIERDIHEICARAIRKYDEWSADDLSMSSSA